MKKHDKDKFVLKMAVLSIKYNKLACQYDQDSFEALKAVVERAIKAIDAQQWIPVLDRLPDVPPKMQIKDCPCFIVTFLNENVNTLKSDGCTWFDDNGNVYKDVIAWKPMPKGYRAENA
jgi:hypothetical protein